MKINKTEIYSKYGIEYKNGYIFHSEFGYIRPLLVNGNEKIGKGVFHFSTLPTNKTFTAEISGKQYEIKGTCPCNCIGCYATKGNYNFKSTINSLAIKTWLAQNDIDFVERAIMAQIEAESIEFLRIHASGDFFSDAYIAMWQRIVKACAGCKFWTYTKNEKAENAFSGLENGNIVKSKIPHMGYNFGHCDYIIAVYNELKKQGKSVYICRCGIDKNQHCNNCKGCSRHEYVLFVEHSTEYKAETDPAYNELKSIIDGQETQAF